MVIGNLVRVYNIKDAYIYEYDPWLGTLVATVFVILCTTNRLKGYDIDQLEFGRDMMLLVTDTTGWELIY